jgi:2'-5' RNA ligase
MIRLFVGIALPEELRLRLAVLGQGVPGARWLPVDNLHLTVRFIGEVDGGVAEDVADAMLDLIVPPFEIELAGVGQFDNRGQPRVLWVGVVPQALLTRLHGKIDIALQRLGLPPDRRKFHPHVTLARLDDSPLTRVTAFLAAHAQFRSGPVPVRQFTLFSSKLGRGGAVYTHEADYELR